jgi:endo-1,4-beta-xylanase
MATRHRGSERGPRTTWSGFTVACTVAAGVLGCGPDDLRGDVGELTAALSVCNEEVPSDRAVDGIPAYDQCAESENSAIYSSNGVDTNTTGGDGWVRTQWSGGYQCTELAHRYLYFVWDVTWIPNGDAGTWCDSLPPTDSGLEQTAMPVHGDVIVFAPGVCGASATYGHVAVVDEVDEARGRVTFVEQNAAGRRTSDIDCGACFLHVVANDGTPPATGGGGAAGIGGGASTGGDATSGGAAGAPAFAPTGGSMPAGGALPAGGTPATGGALALGGTAFVGGAAPTGGATAGAGPAPTGGQTTTGGFAPTGGSSTTTGGGPSEIGGDVSVERPPAARTRVARARAARARVARATTRLAAARRRGAAGRIRHRRRWTLLPRPTTTRAAPVGSRSTGVAARRHRSRCSRRSSRSGADGRGLVGARDHEHGAGAADPDDGGDRLEEQRAGRRRSSRTASAPSASATSTALASAQRRAVMSPGARRSIVSRPADTVPTVRSSSRSNAGVTARVEDDSARHGPRNGPGAAAAQVRSNSMGPRSGPSAEVWSRWAAAAFGGLLLVACGGRVERATSAGARGLGGQGTTAPDGGRGAAAGTEDGVGDAGAAATTAGAGGDRGLAATGGAGGDSPATTGGRAAAGGASTTTAGGAANPGGSSATGGGLSGGGPAPTGGEPASGGLSGTGGAENPGGAVSGGGAPNGGAPAATSGGAGAGGDVGAGGSGAELPRFVGTTTTGWMGDLDTDGLTFSDYWAQVTPENAGKWGSVQSRVGAAYNWTTLDAVHDQAVASGVVFKEHTLVWGSAQPSGVTSQDDVIDWIRSFCERYPDTQLIDVVNEPSPHTTPYYVNEIGGGTDGDWQWVTNSFLWARQYCPQAVLILNDYGNIEWPTQSQHFIDLVNTVRENGGPIDALGAQAHDVDHPSVSFGTVSSLLEKLHEDTGLPVYITELDLSYRDDGEQLSAYQRFFPLFWGADFVRGITLWGWIYGSTASTAPDAGLVRDGVPRPAMDYLMAQLGRSAP